MKTKISILFFSIFCFFSCKKDKNDILYSELATIDAKITPNTKYVFILTDNNCPSCNKKFAYKLQERINDENSIIILNSKGLMYDISMFENKENVIKITSLNNYFQTSRIYVLENKNIVQEVEVTINNADKLPF